VDCSLTILLLNSRSLWNRSQAQSFVVVMTFTDFVVVGGDGGHVFVFVVVVVCGRKV